jgi:hypothetical protein
MHELRRAMKAPQSDGTCRSQKWLADIVGIAQPSISGWMSGRSRPEPHHREVLHRVLGIDPALWYTADERRAMARAAVRADEVPATGTDGR